MTTKQWTKWNCIYNVYNRKRNQSWNKIHSNSKIYYFADSHLLMKWIYGFRLLSNKQLREKLPRMEKKNKNNNNVSVCITNTIFQWKEYHCQKGPFGKLHRNEMDIMICVCLGLLSSIKMRKKSLNHSNYTYISCLTTYKIWWR